MGFLQVAIGVCLIILSAGLVNYISLRARNKGRMAKMAIEEGGVIEQRLSEIERRITDVQDIILAMSDKMDRLDEDQQLKLK
jgi:hypothetical protein